jgi:uncharacterized protein (DUF1800 family)
MKEHRSQGVTLMLLALRQLRRSAVVIPGRRAATSPEPKNTKLSKSGPIAAGTDGSVFMGSGFRLRRPRNDALPSSVARVSWVLPSAFLVVSFFVSLSQAAQPGLPATDRQIIHVLDRLAFGPTRDDVAHVRAVGVDHYIAEQLDPAAIPENPELIERLAALDTLKLNPVQLFVEYGPPRAANGVQPTPEERKARREKAKIIVQQATEARLLRALYSRRQLQEVMVDFWFNHFNVFANKGLDHLWIGAYEEAAIRPHALGKFRDLLLATARHPAMLFYLDNVQNSAPGSKGRDGRDVGLNENYARELMELHTLGADGGYSQDDVIALARVLTGWGLARPNVKPPDGTAFLFDAARHDTGPKRLLGHDIAASGEEEGIEAINLLARHPATAHHIAFKLAQYFVADTPPPTLVDRIAARFTETDGDIRATLQPLFAGREFRDGIGSKYKTPYRYVLSAVRAAGVPVHNLQPLLNNMARLGQPLYGCQTPDGYSDVADKWLSPDATTMRVNFAMGLGAGTLPLDKPPPQPPGTAAGSMAGAMAESGGTTALPTPAPKKVPVDADALQKLLDPVLSSNTHAVVTAAPPEHRAALLLGSPDFMRR